MSAKSTETSDKPGVEAAETASLNFTDRLAAIARFIWTKMFLLLLLIVVIVFTLIGGAVLYAVEKPNESKNHKNQLKEQESNIRLLFSKLQEIACHNDTECSESMEREIFKHADGWNKTIEEKNKYNWQNYWNAVWYATTIYTTIGYGNLSPATDAGKIFTIIYALIGIPLMLAFLNELGKKLCYLCDAMCTKLQHFRGKNIKKTCRFPIVMALVIMILYLLICSVFVLLTAKSNSINNYLDGLYFNFISLTTIGLGDVMPEDPKEMLRAFPLCFIGLALVSTVISMLNARIEDKYFAAIEAIRQKDKHDDVKSALESTFGLSRCHFTVEESDKAEEDGCKQRAPAVLGMNKVRPEYRKQTYKTDIESDVTENDH